MKTAHFLFTLALVSSFGVTQAFGQRDLPPDIADSAAQQIAEINFLKQGFTDAQKKIEANLVFAAQAANGQLNANSVANVASSPGTDSFGNVTVDIYGNITVGLVADVFSANGLILDQSPQWGIIHASVPLTSIETIAANSDVTSIQSAPPVVTNAGSLTSQGYISHMANQVVNMGINGAGVIVGVLSDSALPAQVSAMIASGDLPPDTLVLPGQQGPSNGANEGIAMMEIVHDMAPGARLIFATAFTGVSSFANNILALQAAGAKVIVDDVTYFNEGAFQDGPIARAVNQVTANGALYFSSAANSGSLSFGTSGTWEGDFQPNGAGAPPLAGAGTVHNFRTEDAPQNFNSLTGISDFISLKWSDPLGASTNDYDLYILNNTGTTVKGFSVGAQTGTQDPYEFIRQGLNCGTPTASGYCPAIGDRIVVVLWSGAPRALRIDTNRGQLSIGTAGSTYGHNAGANTVSTAATYWASARSYTQPFTGAANPNEVFSSDGPRKIFYNPDGSAITPGNFLFSTEGGTTLLKPDIAAADGTTARTLGFNPFFGTSAAAPHAAGIAALILTIRPTWTPAQVLDAIKSTALDSMEPGVDRDSGSGIAMALASVLYAMTH